MKNLFLFLPLLLSSFIINAQFADDMESYTDGEPIYEGHWSYWNCDNGGDGCAILSSSAQSHSGNFSGLIPNDGTTSAILDLGNKVFDLWAIEFFMYVPSNNEAYWNINNCNTTCDENNICTTICDEDWNIHFNFNKDLNSPGAGTITNSPLGDINFTFPHDQWFRVVIFWDFANGVNLGTWEMAIANLIVIPEGTVFTIEDGSYPSYPNGLGSLNFSSPGVNNNYFLDDLYYTDNWMTILENNEITNTNFNVFPNPVVDQLNINSEKTITSISITNILGQEVLNKDINSIEAIIDVSALQKGTYFLKVVIGNTTEIKKIIK